MAGTIKLTRGQISKIVGGDVEAIKTFEKLIALTNVYLDSGLVDSAGEEAANAAFGLASLASTVQALVDSLDRQPIGVDLTALEGRVQAMEQARAMLPVLVDRISALEGAPLVTPHLKRFAYGAFVDTTSQTQAAINTALAMTFNTTEHSSGVTIGSPTSRVYVDRSNVYNIQFSAQINNSGGSPHRIYIWLRVNGVDVANSTTTIRVEGNNTEAVAAWNFVHEFNAGDYFELMWEVTDLGITLQNTAATAVHPANPSIILTVTDNIKGE